MILNPQSPIRNPQLHGRYPFRLGCTSYVYPDTIVPNVEKMASLVDDIELVIFESADFGNVPDITAAAELKRLAQEHDITYSVHFPINHFAGSTDIIDRHQFMDQALRIINLVSSIPLSGYVLHLEGIKSDADDNARNAWLNACDEVCAGIALKINKEHASVFVENLGYPLEWHESVVNKFQFGHCLDIGHLWLYQSCWREQLVNYICRSGIIHFHGLNNGKDHLSLAKGNMDDLKFVIDCLRKTGFSGVITLEVFGKDDTFESIGVFEKLWRQ